MTQEKNTIQPLDFIIIYIGGAFIAGWLQQLLRQSHELADLTGHYYERGYYRNEKYTL